MKYKVHYEHLSKSARFQGRIVLLKATDWGGPADEATKTEVPGPTRHGWALVRDGWALMRHGWALGRDGWALVTHGWALVRHGWAFMRHGWVLVRYGLVLVRHAWAL